MENNKLKLENIHIMFKLERYRDLSAPDCIFATWYVINQSDVTTGDGAYFYNLNDNLRVAVDIANKIYTNVNHKRKLGRKLKHLKMPEIMKLFSSIHRYNNSGWVEVG